MVDNISNIMTDRCAVNQAAIRLIDEEWKKKLNVAFCHLHPLDMEEKIELDTRKLSKSGCISAILFCRI